MGINPFGRDDDHPNYTAAQVTVISPESGGSRALAPILGAWLPSLVLMGWIYWASSQSTLPRPFVPVVEWMGDKAAHASVYGLLALLYILGLHVSFPLTSTTRKALGAAFLATLYGGADEWHQRYVPGRSADWQDWAADAVGAVCAAVMVYWLSRRLAAATDVGAVSRQ